jgi:signal transduction histidine kinase
MLLDASRAIISQNCLDAVLRRVVRGAHRLMNARLCSLMLLSENEKELILKTWHGASADYTRKPNIPVDDSLVGAVIRRKKTLAVADVQEHSRYLYTELARREKLVSLLCAPLVFQGRIMGVLSVYTGQRHRFSNEEIRLLNAMAGMSAVAIAKAQMLDRIVAVEEDLKASERLCALGWLAAEMAHEIRNPLTVAQMLFHSLTQEVSFSGRALDDIRLIAEKMALMNRSLDRILGFARSAEPSRERLDAATLLEDIVLLTRHKLAEQKIELRTRVPKTPLPLLGDKAQLGQAILNLVLNAVQAMPKGGFLILSAKAQSLRGENLIAIGVRDTGTGISAKRRKTLFQPFLTDKKSGTGLGLALVKKTIESHGGSIRVRSSPGKGAAFTLLLPEARMDCL